MPAKLTFQIHALCQLFLLHQLMPLHEGANEAMQHAPMVGQKLIGKHLQIPPRASPSDRHCLSLIYKKEDESAHSNKSTDLNN